MLLKWEFFPTLNSINRLIPIMETECVSCDVVTAFLSVILDLSRFLDFNTYVEFPVLRNFTWNKNIK